MKFYNQIRLKYYVHNKYYCKLIHPKEKPTDCEPIHLDEKNVDADKYDPKFNASKHPNIFITTPLFYTNAPPHLGHLYSALLADTRMRWEIMALKNVIDSPNVFVTGTDEHGNKIAKAALAYSATNKSSQENKYSNLSQILVYCDKMSARFKTLFDDFGIHYTSFVRTSQTRHEETVHWLWDRIYAHGYIYPGYYQGWYDLIHEEFIPPDEAIVDIKYVKNENFSATNHDHHHSTSYDGTLKKIGIRESNKAAATWIKEPNYMLSLRKFGPAIVNWLESSPITEVLIDNIKNNSNTLGEKALKSTVNSQNDETSTNLHENFSNSAHLQSNSIVKPEFFAQLALKYAREMCRRDVSVSRLRSKVKWGIPVPNDSSQTIYVWFDALAGYLTGSGFRPLVPHHEHHSASAEQILGQTHHKRAGLVNQDWCWPPTHQYVGKDILKFHCVLWPAILLAAGLELPRRIICHSHWLMDHQKMSKSLGNVVDPLIALNETFGGSREGLRYALLRGNSELAQDSNYNPKRLKDLVNSELANTLGNLINRAASLHLKLSDKFITALQNLSFSYSDNQYSVKFRLAALEMIKQVEYNCTSDVSRFDRALQHIMDFLRDTNLAFEDVKPWLYIDSKDSTNLAKNSKENENFSPVLDLFVATHNCLRVAGIALQPFVPELASSLLGLLDLAPSQVIKIGKPLHSSNNVYDKNNPMSLDNDNINEKSTDLHFVPWSETKIWHDLDYFTHNPEKLIFDAPLLNANNNGLGSHYRDTNINSENTLPNEKSEINNQEICKKTSVFYPRIP